MALSARSQTMQALDHAVMLPHEKAAAVSYVDTLEKTLRYVIDSLVGTGYHDLRGHGIPEDSVKFIEELCEQIPYPHGWEP